MSLGKNAEMCTTRDLNEPMSNSAGESRRIITVHRFYSAFAVAKQLFEGKSLTRSLFNLALKNLSVGGRVLDLGSKDGRGSYYEFLNIDSTSEFVYTDLNAVGSIVRLNVEESFPFEECTFDAVFAFHLFEHVFEFRRAPCEIFRILKPGGSVIVAVPFLHEYHADEQDYFRFTDSSLRRLWEEAGFVCVHLEAIGEGLFTTFLTKMPDLLLPRWVRRYAAALLYIFATPIDRFVARVRPRIDGKSVPERFALDHVAVFKKPW